MSQCQKWLILFICSVWNVQGTSVTGAEGQLQCLSSTSLSCTEGITKGRIDTIETRLLFSANFTCPGTIVGWIVAGRRGEGMQYPQLQIWRGDSSRSSYYNKQGQDIQVDAQGSACELITQTCGHIYQCRLRAANRVTVQRDDILGVELPPLTSSSGFELFFISVPNTQNHFIFRRQLGSTVQIRNVYGHSFRHLSDQLLISLEIEQGNTSSQFNSETNCSNNYNTSSQLNTDERNCTCSGSGNTSMTSQFNSETNCSNNYNTSSQLNTDERNCSCSGSNNISSQFNPDGRNCFNNISLQFNSDGRNCSETIGTACLIIGATVGGAVGTPLLLLIILLLVILTCVIKRNSDKSKIITQKNEVYEESFHETQLKDVSADNIIKLPCEEDDIYTNVQ